MTGILELGTAVGKILLDTSGVDRPLSQVSGSLSGFFKGGKEGSMGLGEAFTLAGAKMTMAFAPLTGYLSGATQSTLKFHEAITNTAAVLTLNADQAKKLSDQILLFSKDTRAGPQQVAEAFYDIAGGVADANLHMTMLQQAVKLSEAGNSSLAGTTSALIAIMNGYSFSADKAGYASDVLTRTVGMGVGTMDQFAAALPNVTGLAHAAGISFENVGQMLAYLTTKGVTASEATTELSSMMTAIIKPNDSMKEALQKIGFATGDAAIKTLGLVGTYKALLKAGYGGDMAALTGRIEALRGVTSLTGNDVEAFFKQFTGGLNGATDAAQKIQMAAPAAQMDLLRSSADALAIKIGEKLVPVLMDIFKFVKPVIESIITWIDQNPELASQIAILGGALAVIGPVLMVIGGAITAVTAAFALLTSPILLVVAGVALVKRAFDTDWMGIRTTVEQLAFIIGYYWDQLFGPKGGLQAAIGGFRLLWDALFDPNNGWLARQWDALFGASGTLTPLVNQLSRLFDSIFGPTGVIANLWATIFDPNNGVLARVWDQLFGNSGTLKPILNQMSTGFTNSLNAIQTGWNFLFNNPDGVLYKVWDSLFGTGKGVNKLIKDTQGTIEAVMNYITPIIEAAIRTIQGVVDKINSAIEAIKLFLGIQGSVSGGFQGGLPGGGLGIGSHVPEGQFMFPIRNASGQVVGYDVKNAQGVHMGWTDANGNPTSAEPHDYTGPYNTSQTYLVGKGAQPELFAPGKGGGSGMAIPNFDKVLQALGVGGSGGGDIIFNQGAVVIYANSKAEGEQAAIGFKEELKKRREKRG